MKKSGQKPWKNNRTLQTQDQLFFSSVLLDKTGDDMV